MVGNMRDIRKVLDIAKYTEPTIFTDDQLAVMNELIKYQDYYDNKAFKYIVAEYPEFRHGIQDGKDYRPAHIPLNYGKLIIDKLAAWQFEENIDFSCISENENRAEEIEADLYEIHKLNHMDIKLLQSAVESNISGGITFKLKYDEKKKYPRILIRNRIETFVITEFDDYEQIIRVHFIAFQDDKTIWKQTYEMMGNICYISEAIYDVQNIREPKEVIIEYQPLGKGGKWLDFLPVYVIPNLAQLGEVWGPSELRDLIPAIDEINKKYSDLSDSLKFDMFAITVFMNAKIPEGPDGRPQLKNKAGAAWRVMGVSPSGELKPEVFKLQGTFNYTETLKYHINTLISALFELSECVNLSPDKVTGLPNLSGIALKLLFASMISKTKRKNIVWKSKLRDIYMGTLKFKQVYEGYEIPDDLDIEVITHMPLPANELEQVQAISDKIAVGLMSVTSAMNELGVEDPEAEIAKIIEEKVEFDKKLNLEQVNNGKENE